MAIKSKAAIDTQLDAAAAALTSAWADDTDTRMAGVLNHPSHPLRQVEKLFKINANTGVVTTDTDYLAKAYDDGKTLAKKNPFDVISKPLAAISTATVEDADVSAIIITFDMALEEGFKPVAGDFALTTDGAPTAVSTVAISGAVLTLDCDDDFVNGDTISVAYTPGSIPIHAAIAGQPVAAFSQSVTNNVT